MARSFLSRMGSAFFRVVNRVIPWHRLPFQRLLGALNLAFLRSDLREWNLFNTSGKKLQEGTPPLSPKVRSERTADGSYNDLAVPNMGRARMRFGRNAALDRVSPDLANLLTPNPREVSRRLMTRDQFQPATTLNLLAAAWIQFMNHGWFNHKRDDKTDNRWQVPLPPGDTSDFFKNPMEIQRTLADDTRTPDESHLPPTYLNTESHWWDGSQLYGSNQDRQNLVRNFQDGKLKIGDDGFLLIDDTLKLTNRTTRGIELTGFNDNWWVGLSLLHTLFVREHNHLCDRLKLENPAWDDERLFQTARLINAAVMAKIHTVEWTPGILDQPALHVSMNGNWWGVLGEHFKRAFGRVCDSEIISGIIGSPTDHHTAPFALTEEFAAVYRLHPLIPDDVTLRSAQDHSQLEPEPFNFMAIQGDGTRDVMQGRRHVDWMYSLGVSHPGAITLHNFPKALQEFTRRDGEKFDLAAVDLLRDRERGVPRYNDFREMLRMPRVRSFDQLTDNPQWATELREVYGGDIDLVDLQVGMQAEPLPKGFGFSDTAFRIFILMASRRLKSDRFFTVDFTPEVYTPFGIEWINVNDMRSVLLRHFPELHPALFRSKNAFAPWTRAG